MPTPTHTASIPGHSADDGHAERIARMNAMRPAFLDLFHGEVSAIDEQAMACTMRFVVSRDFCHSVDIIQGGFVTAMLDAAMSHAAFALVPGVTNVATLEIKVSFLEASRAGRYRAVGYIERAGRSTGFMRGELYNEQDVLTATSTTTARLVRAKPETGGTAA